LWSNLRKIGSNKNPLETIAGALILIVSFYFFSWGVMTARTSRTFGYTLVANFANTGGVGRGADVSVSGVRIGQVAETSLRQADYTVDIVMTIDRAFELPRDTVATISTAGLIGDKYIALEIGSSREMAAHGDRLRSLPFRPIEEIIGDFIFKEGGK
jgi:phospholipid/cholesterol/gamma-HCH transport system substrate-binding protein